jgi:hypothetical protein
LADLVRADSGGKPLAPGVYRALATDKLITLHWKPVEGAVALTGNRPHDNHQRFMR